MAKKAKMGLVLMPVFVVLVGYNGSGKTTLAKKLEADLNFNVVSGDPLRLLMKKEIRYLHDFDISIPTERGRLTRNIVNTYRKMLCRALLQAGQSVICDSNALKKSDREEIFREVLGDNVTAHRAIISAAIDEDALLQRLRNRPEPNWVEHYQAKKLVFEAPEPNECDTLLTYNQTNYEEIRTKLQQLVG